MKTNYLFSYRCKRIGWILFIPGLIVGILILIVRIEVSQWEFLKIPVFAILDKGIMDDDVIFGWTKTYIHDELGALLLIIGGILIAFSRQKIEDELIAKIRLESLIWATYINYGILALCIIFLYGLAFLEVMVYNMFSLLIFFMIRFNWVLYRSNKMITDEE
jgi:hypothetical protein